MYEEMKTNQVVKILAARPLGFSQIRLLPKVFGNGRIVLGRSINSVMTPVFNVLNYEKSTQPGKLGSSLFSVGDMFPRLREFRNSLQQRGLLGQPLYFAKVDVKSCFDTIPQNSLVALVEELLSVNEYSVVRHAEIKRLPSHQQDQPDKFTTRFVADGQAAGSPEQPIYTDARQVRRNTIFVDLGVPQIQHKRKVLHLLKEHVERNIVKIGKKYYRQKEGIPQGSVLSSLLCNFFYAKLERECLDFVQTEDCLLLRLVDDFLLISVRREHAEDFLQVMHNGVPAYGLAVKAEKSLANFDVEINGRRIESTKGAMQFPYCGNTIHT
ncbi:Telomerase reverse transcriptase, partial [Cryomyces antarcticus]